MKQRFSSLDVKVIVHELSEALVSLRVANIYDLSSKILLLKFAKPNSKQQLIIDSGFRCHLTDFARATAAAPSAFVIRLRKFLKTRRVTSVAQIGTDRIIEFQFSDGAYRLYLEFFASGNVILTDAELKIQTLLRNVPEGEGQEPQRVGLTYNLQNRQNFGGVPPLTKERLRDALTTTVEKAAASGAAGAKTKRKGGADLRRGLATTITEVPPVLMDHAFRATSFDSKVKPAEVLANAELFDALFLSLGQARDVIEKLTSSATTKGYIIAKPKPGAKPGGENPDAAQEETGKGLLYEDFHPFLPKQFEDDAAYRIVAFDGFNKTVDEFFSSVEGQKLESRLSEREAAARRKLDAARKDQEKRIEGLQGVQLLNLRKAAAIEANIERVQEAMDAVNGLLEQGMDWVDVTRLIEREKKRQNPVAEVIKLPLKLDENTITLLLGEEEEQAEEDLDFDYETDEEVEDEAEDKQKLTDKQLAVDIKLNLSPWVNAREYYGEKRSAADKAQKTIQQSALALENAERKIAEDLKKGLKQEKPVLQLIRKAMWFEKFIWFISSDGYLVLGGRDVQQNEMLYKRYLRKGDVYVHADLHGASSVIIKNNPKTPDAPIPPSTLTQAGHLSVCSSTAWDSKAGMSAWWVNADQVSKSAPTGEFLPAGSFMVRGKKNFLPPAQLMLGFGLMFKVSEESKAKHFKNRLYDHEAVSSSATPSVAANETEPTAEDVLEPGDASDSGDDIAEEDADHSRPTNPLQANGPQGTNTAHDNDEPEESLEPPSAQLAATSITSSNPAAEEDLADEETGVPEDPEEPEEPEEDDQDEETEAPSGVVTPATAATSQVSSKKGPVKRGQRSKTKKAAKYKDQDEEDRQIMESLTGVAKARERAQAEAVLKAQKEAEAAAAQERRRQRQERAKKEIADHEEIRRVMLEEGVEYLDPAESLEATPLDSLVGTPLVGDEILEAIPICAPWLAMAKIKYKAKLQPGNTKKGKAVKEIIERWRLAASKKGVVDESAADNEKMWPREVELIKSLKAEEAFNCVPVGKVTVMAAGGNTTGGGASSKGGQGKGKGGRGGKGSKRK
ncbi:hypothetical protein GQ53DRAFT_844692 [Thozetella sp. PMI_491]|nr:hypothetical protein GQ53DRAFT_844692 [Thozetella sp. PMI_491]